MAMSATFVGNLTVVGSVGTLSWPSVRASSCASPILLRVGAPVVLPTLVLLHR
jgi:Na+/H+ antiporter NhaD/arsenite permease-like protein